MSRSGVWGFLKHYEETGAIQRKQGSGRPSALSREGKELIDETMHSSDETTTKELRAVLRSRGHNASLSTVLRCRRQLGWTVRGSAYCQLIHDSNKLKRLVWAQQYLKEAAEGFRDVIFTDETSVQLESHRRFACRKIGQPPRPKPRYFCNALLLCGNFLQVVCLYVIFVPSNFMFYCIYLFSLQS